MARFNLLAVKFPVHWSCGLHFGNSANPEKSGSSQGCHQGKRAILRIISMKRVCFALSKNPARQTILNRAQKAKELGLNVIND